MRLFRTLAGVLIAGFVGAGGALAAEPTFSPPITVVPSAGLPASVKVDRSNANLSAVMHKGRLYMVFRTAKWQIADDNAVLYAVSTKDQTHWRLEGEFRHNRDMREPRLLSFKGKLYLYYALLGSNPVTFAPGGTLATRLVRTGHWTAPRKILIDDFIPWAVKNYKGAAYMLGYTGGGGTFQLNQPDKLVYWLKTKNGFDWKAVDPEKPVVYRGQCGETDFAFRRDGTLVTACQTEAVDKLGWGAKVCTAPPRHSADWTCRGDPRRLDSPWVMTHGDDVFVIARRQVAFGGDYDLHMSLVGERNVLFGLYDASYAATTKRCAVWRIDPVTRRFEPLRDIPGIGDTCYPSVVQRPHGRYLVYNYTSPLDGIDDIWITALTFGRTEIYRTTMRFP